MGRIAAVHKAGGESDFRLLAGSSLSAGEVSALLNVLADPVNLAELKAPGSIEIVAPWAAERSQRLRLYALSLEGETPSAILALLRDRLVHEAEPRLNLFLDNLLPLAALIIEDRLLRDRLVSQQNLLSSILEIAPDAIIRINQKGEIQDFLGRAEAMFGWTSEEAVGRNISCLMPQQDARRHDYYIEAFLATGEPRLPYFGRRLDARRKDGEAMPVEFALSETRNSQGEQSLVAFVRDVSRRVEHERELQEMREALEIASRQSAAGEMALMLAHELAQPLTALSTYMDALAVSLDGAREIDPAQLRSIGRKASEQARFCGAIMGRMGRIAQYDSFMKLDDVFDVVSDIAKLLRDLSAAEGVRFELRCEGEDPMARFDRIQLQQVLLNLGRNALNAMRGSDSPVLMVKVDAGEDEIELAVTDTGPGVSDDKKKAVFERFFSGSQRFGVSGLGLGLAIVRRIAEAHDGRAWVEDVPGGGACFRVAFPRAEKQGAPQ